ncbi:MAG: AbrB/MazE/SpoVT family DNA-binding domain-containing protein [Candidatus Magnetobacterium sp. LHC-1]|uniref:AbrB/MazE/SpoVT family DNA-binding domain-containing protein n=1 Tax=Candidatus Magnetobacterium casense TaxID=1455061 RepID=A0ABS6RU26_9BACT|nr:AbrB/MazE/SpoVT family DNA-binding domain-containing protein [Candidatus Magnetobacterium casensis]MBF0608135.1 AbrB/MazE/SpoVT family DNA-binding domain-containing protein [Nitrospirota bacterium]MBV6340130.1 AbrB/MazE/SpoVT family DNA-binding domain-containing protein [Candidatus Magnetobacterium casensis]
MNKETTTLSKVNRNFQITLPTEFRKRFNIQEGDFLEVVENEEGVIVRPVEIAIRRKQVVEKLHEIYDEISQNPYANLPEEQVMEIVNEQIKQAREEKNKELASHA